MTRLLLNIATALVFFVAAAVAQSTPETDTPGTQGSSPSMGQGTSASSTGMQGTEYKGKGEKKLKGCIQSQGGSYVLQEKSGKIVALTGADLSAHVGHEVAVHGSWEAGAGSSSAASSGGGMGSSDKARKQFNVNSVEMVSESCGRGKRKPIVTSPQGGPGTGTCPPK